MKTNYFLEENLASQKYVLKEKALQAISNLESYSPWIDPEDKLPQEEEEVIITVKDELGDTSFLYTTYGWYFDGNWFSDNKRIFGVRAWRFFPEPYKEDF